MIFLYLQGRQMPSPMGCAEGLAPCLIGEFSAIRSIAARTNSLISYGIFSVNTLRRAVRLSVCLSAVAVPAACVPITPPYYFFPFGRWVAGRSFPFAKASLAWGSRKQGFPDKYARSEARGRFVGKRHSRLTLKPTSSPVLNLPLKTGMIAPLCLRQGNYHLYFPPNSVNFVVLVY